MSDSPLQLAVLISGAGTTLGNFVEKIREGKMRASITQVIASRPGIGGIEIAKSASLPCEVIASQSFSSMAVFSRAVFGRCASADLICFAGWLPRLEIPQNLGGRIMNIHPSLLPAFGGSGMYGKRVHEAVLAQGCKITGCTVHFVDGEYDAGPIILQRTCPVEESDTAATLAARVFAEEKIAYPMAVELFRQKRLRIEGRRVKVLDHH